MLTASSLTRVDPVLPRRAIFSVAGKRPYPGFPLYCRLSSWDTVETNPTGVEQCCCVKHWQWAERHTGINKGVGPQKTLKCHRTLTADSFNIKFILYGCFYMCEWTAVNVNSCVDVAFCNKSIFSCHLWTCCIAYYAFGIVLWDDEFLVLFQFMFHVLLSHCVFLSCTESFSWWGREFLSN